MTQYLSVDSQLETMQQWLGRRVPFFHTRYNDGECITMFGTRSADGTASGEHHYLPEVGRALLSTFTELMDVASERKPRNLLVGSYIAQSFHQVSGLGRGGERLVGLVTSHGLMESMPWAAPDLWYDTEAEIAMTCAKGNLIGLFDAIRNCGAQSVLVGNETIADAKRSLGAEFVEIPKVDAWYDRKRIMADCRPHAERGSVFVWCAGFPGKVLSWRLWKRYPQSSHIDAGHLLDGVFGVQNRKWLQRGFGTHWDFYQNTFAPYVRSFIP